MLIQTEYDFTLPRGYVDKDGNLNREGVMRLARAVDEISVMKDPRVQQNPSYLTLLLLSKVIVKLGSLQTIDTDVTENLFTADLEYLQDFYQRINQADVPAYECQCPKCGEVFEMPLNFS